TILLEFVSINVLLSGWPWHWSVENGKVSGLLPLIVLFMFTERVLERRRLTELLADACAASHVGLAAVIDALELLASDKHRGYVTTEESSREMTDHSGGIHPHPSFRMWHLRQMFTQIDLAG